MTDPARQTMTTRRSFRIYIGGPIQGENLLHSLRNIDNGESWQAKLFQLGFSPFPVFSDFSFLMRVRPVPNIQDIYNYSLQWLKVADAMLVIEGWEKSTGCRAEMAEAERSGVPIFHDVVELCAWADKQIIPPMPSIDEMLSKGDD